MQSKSPGLVATTVFHACFKSLEIMKQHTDNGFPKHSSIASKHIKFLCHNSPFETLELHDTRIKSVEASIKEAAQKSSSRDDTLNTTSQKIDDGKSKIANLESRVARLEKK